MATDTVKQDVRDESTTLERKLCFLSAMLTMTYGDVQESFDCMGTELRSDYMAACSALADECKNLSFTINEAIQKQGAATV